MHISDILQQDHSQLVQGSINTDIQPLKFAKFFASTFSRHQTGQAPSLSSQHPTLALLSSGGAALPAFGMAVFKSPSASRSPSAEKNQLALLMSPATAAEAPTTAAEAPTTAAGSATVAAPAAAAVLGSSTAGAAEAAGSGVQPSGSKRKRDGVGSDTEVDLPAGVKQARQAPSSAEQYEQEQDASGPTFHLLRSHK